MKAWRAKAETNEDADQQDVDRARKGGASPAPTYRLCWMNRAVRNSRLLGSSRLPRMRG